MPEMTTASVAGPGGLLLPFDGRDPRKKFLETPGYTRKPGERLTWMDKRDLEMGYGLVLRLFSEKNTYSQISAKTRLPVAAVKMVVRDYMACKHYPSTPEVLRLRLAGKSIPAVAVHYGLTTDEVREILDGELKQMEGPIGQMAIEVARAERYFEVLEPQIEAGNLAAIQMGIRVAEHKMAVIQTQIETSRDIASAKTTLVDLLNQLDAEVVHNKPALPAGVIHEAHEHQDQGDDGGGAATSVEDC